MFNSLHSAHVLAVENILHAVEKVNDLANQVQYLYTWNLCILYSTLLEKFGCCGMKILVRQMISISFTSATCINFYNSENFHNRSFKKSQGKFDFVMKFSYHFVLYILGVSRHLAKQSNFLAEILQVISGKKSSN